MALASNCRPSAHARLSRFSRLDEVRGILKRPIADKATLLKPFPEAPTFTLANLVRIEKAQLTQPLTKRLIRFTTLQNPEFYRAQSMRISVRDKTSGLPFCTALPLAGQGARTARIDATILERSRSTLSSDMSKHATSSDSLQHRSEGTAKKGHKVKAGSRVPHSKPWHEMSKLPIISGNNRRVPLPLRTLYPVSTSRNASSKRAILSRSGTGR